jgi:hypothetical protein
MSDVRIFTGWIPPSGSLLSKAIASCALALLAPAHQPARAAPGASSIPMQVAELKAQDVRLAATIFRLAVANRKLCGNVMPATGLVLHGRDQYSAAVRAAAGASLQFETAVAVEGIIPDSPAYHAGIRENDAIVAISGIPVQPIAAPTDRTSAPRDQVEKLLASLPPTQPIDIAYSRAGTQRSARILPLAACRVRSEVLSGSALAGQTDGAIAQFGDRVLNGLDMQGLAALAAHELAHVVLEHRRKLEAMRVQNGLLGEFGSSRVARRQAEIDADRLSVHLLANAGMNPMLLLEFWLGPGRAIAPDLFRSRAYPSRKDRMAIIESEILARAASIRTSAEPN